MRTRGGNLPPEVNSVSAAQKDSIPTHDALWESSSISPTTDRVRIRGHY